MAALVGAAPVAFGSIRAVTTGHDFRYLWVAAAALAGSLSVLPPTRTTVGARPPTLWRGFFAGTAGAACACVMALLLGTRLGPGLAVVAVAFGLCTGASVMLAARALGRDLGREQP